MSETLAELAETDALLTALSRGNVLRTGDPVYDALSGWVDEIMSHPAPRIEVELPEFYARETGSRAWRLAAAGIVVAAMSSSGIAAAATGDPLAPFNYVATALGHLAPDGPAETRNGARILDGIERSRETQQSQSGATTHSYSPAAADSTGRHRAPGHDDAPRHRADDASNADGSQEATDNDYTPRHVAPDASDNPSSPPAETPPVETPPVETPVPETPPVTDPPPTDAEPQPVPGDGPVVGQPGPGAEEAPPVEPAPTESGPTGGGAADAPQVRSGEDAPVETPADQAVVE